MFQTKMNACIAALALLAASTTSFAQFTDTGPASTVEGGGIPGAGTLLWDNTVIGATNNGIVSLQGDNLPAGANQVNSADDFVIPAGEVWDISFVFTTGFTSAGAADPDSFGIEFYADNAGLPGALLANRVVPFGGVVTDATQELTLPSPVNLSEGTYWVSVFGIYNTFNALATERWNWTTGPTAIGNEDALQDTGSFFGSPLPWTPLSALVGTGAPSIFFALRGNATVGGGGVLPPPADVPTLSSFGLVAMVLALLLISGLVLRRRSH